MSRPAVVVLSADLFFRARIETVGQAAGTPVVFAASLEEVEAALGIRGDGPEPRSTPGRLVLVDLTHRQADPVGTIRALKSLPESPKVVAFGPHRDREIFRAAHEAGADRVLARSAFVEHLADLLRGGP